jgi:radical SAM superfamily enzyme YgiQ (UPF0313 family)
MHILLVAIDAKFIHTNNAVRLLQANSVFDVSILEFTIQDDPTTIAQAIQSKAPDVVGFSVYLWNVDLVEDILKEPTFPSIPVVLGGPEVGYDPMPFLSWPHVTVIVRGEGETVFDAVIERIQQNRSFDGLSNLAWLDGDTPVLTPIEEVQDLEHLQPPYFRDEDLPNLPHRIGYIEASRGCPYRCSYCLSSLEQSVRFFPLDGVLKAIDHYMDHGVKTIKFLDRTFNANRQTMAILDHIIRHDNRTTVFQFEITGDVLDPRILDYLHQHARPGLFRFEIGIQSTNDDTNRLVDRRQNTAKLFEIIRSIQQAGVIDLHLDLIAGLPAEDKASFIRTFDEVFRLGAKELQLGFLKLLRGTKIRLEHERFDYRFDPRAPYEIRRNHVLSEQDIEEIKLVEDMLELHHNKGHFGPQMKEFLLASESPYERLLELGLHYRKNQYPTHGYQLDELYQRVIERWPQLRFELLQDYLSRFPIKPKRFFVDGTTRSQRHTILQRIAEEQNPTINDLFKHAIVITEGDRYFCAYYQNGRCHTYQGTFS